MAETKTKKSESMEEVIEGKVTKVVSKGGELKVSVDSSVKDVVTSVEKGDRIVFDPEDLPVFSEEELEAFPYRVVKEYRKAKVLADQAAPKAPRIEVLDILGNSALNRIKLRFRRGWHQTWKRPDELDEAIDNGYVVVRKKGKDEEKPGQETGEIVKIGTPEKVELIGMEINQERYDRHLQAVREKSVRAYKANKENFKESVEVFNSRVPDRADRAKVIDDEGDV